LDELIRINSICLTKFAIIKWERGGFSQKATSIRKMLPDILGIPTGIRRMLIAFGSKAPGMGWDMKVIGQIYSKRCQFQYNKIVISDL